MCKNLIKDKEEERKVKNFVAHFDWTCPLFFLFLEEKASERKFEIKRNMFSLMVFWNWQAFFEIWCFFLFFVYYFFFGGGEGLMHLTTILFELPILCFTQTQLSNVTKFLVVLGARQVVFLLLHIWLEEFSCCLLEPAWCFLNWAKFS